MKPSFRFCFTLDTEPDDLWSDPVANRFEHFDRLVGFHRRLVDAGARPTYLTTSEVAESAKAREALETCLGSGGTELGAHFHVWTRSWPFPVPTPASPRVHMMAHELEQPLEEKMLAFTCEALEKAFGVRPRSYRGGRWSFAPHTPLSLRNCGIEVDSTFTPGLRWHHGPDYRHASVFPQRLSTGSGSFDGGGRSPIELPVGTAFFPGWAQRLSHSDPVERLLARTRRATGLRIGLYLLRPTDTAVEDMVAVMRSLQRQACPVWVFMIHSSEIDTCRRLPTREAVEAFVERCIAGVRAAVDLGARPATLTEAAAWVDEAGHLR